MPKPSERSSSSRTKRPAARDGPDRGRSRAPVPYSAAMWRPLLRSIAALAGAMAAAATVPRAVCSRGGPALYAGDRAAQAELARWVATRVIELDGDVVYRSGEARFDGQASVATYQMTLLGLGQTVRQHPELRGELLPAMRIAARRLASPATLAYAARVYGAHGVTRMAPGTGHAYLGYVGRGLGMMRQLAPDMPEAAVHDRITQALAARLAASETGLIETYPGETWPPDVAAVAGAIGLHGRATGHDWSPVLRPFADRFSACAIDPETGYLVQRVTSGGCQRLDAPRGSGTAVAAYFLSFADRDLSGRLHRALRERGHRELLGFGGILEDPTGTGRWDGNAGPGLLGVSTGATGFGIGAARAHGDRALYLSLHRTATLFGVPVRSPPGRSFAVGGLLGNALLLAMLTAETPP